MKFISFILKTLEHILQAGKFDKQSYTTREEPRLREQDWGNFQDPNTIQVSSEERKIFGNFYYRFPYGESGSGFFFSLPTPYKFQIESFLF